MPTPKQEKLAREIIENSQRDKPLTAKEMLVNVGYATSVAEVKPKEIIEAEGVQSELVRLGFTEDKAKSVVAEIMTNSEVEPNARLKAADMTFKVHGSYAPEKSVAVQVRGDVKDFGKYKTITDKFEQELLNGYQT